MKHKLILAILTLAIFASVFSLQGVSVLADPINETLEVNEAWIENDMLKIDVIDTQSGTNSTMELDLADYDLSKEYISVQVEDADGNKSNAVKIQNPYYTAPTTESEIPFGAFTPDGDGTVIDNLSSGDGKEFFTIKTAADNEFFLIIDRRRDTENVYFLNAITEADLLEMAQKNSNNGGTSTSAIPTPAPSSKETESPQEPKSEPQQSQDSGSGFMIFLVIGIVLAGGAYWYFKIYRPKQQSADNDESGDDFDDDDYDDADDDSEYEDGDDE